MLVRECCISKFPYERMSIQTTGYIMAELGNNLNASEKGIHLLNMKSLLNQNEHRFVVCHRVCGDVGWQFFRWVSG